jgi:cysteine synthase A
MLNDAEARGVLKPGSVIIEPTSGNTGIALAAIGSARGYRVIIVMPENMSPARVKIMQAYGAEVMLTPASLGMTGSVQVAKEVAQNTQNSVILGQFDNPANPDAHVSTANEILRDVGKVDIFVCAVGTGGTLTGTARELKKANPSLKVVAIEPAGSPVLSGGKAGPHGIQGIGAGFIPSVLDVSLIDEVVTVTEAEAENARALLAKAEGLFAGISSGAAICAALRVAGQKENAGKRIITILPDGGERYL